MAMVLGQVSIEDFDKFLEVFQGPGAPLREKHGCRGARVFRDDDDPALAFVLLDWDREGIKAFQRDPEVAETMRSGTAIAPPAFTYLEQEAELPA
jgi:quinol monooxygenase YgiN